MRRRQQITRLGFSLLEVILAVGVLSVAVVALIGIVGPLLRGMTDDQASGELEAVLATIRQWSAEEASEDYDAMRGELRSGVERILYRVESQSLDDAGWTLSDSGEFASELSSASASRFVRGPSAYYLEMSSESELADSYEPFVISMWIAGVPEPGSNVSNWASALQARDPDHVVRYVIHR